jgi:restriction endonuclease Mrr
MIIFKHSGEKGLLGVLDIYEELMMPMFLRLGGNIEQLCMDEPVIIDVNAAHSRNRLRSIRDINVAAVSTVGSAHRAAMREIEESVLEHVYAQTPFFFEGLIIDLLLAMGYANRKRDLTRQVGRSHDGGVDGIISQDPLGLDVILLQAKRIRPDTSVSASQIRDFIGTLETQKATKGIFVTTGGFSAFAKSTIERVPHRVRLINGRELSGLMVRHNLGVKPTQSYVFKELDPDYFVSAEKSELINQKSINRL